MIADRVIYAAIGTSMVGAADYPDVVIDADGVHESMSSRQPVTGSVHGRNGRNRCSSHCWCQGA
jgi:hypothetical protein